jgi:hypothetical protein
MFGKALSTHCALVEGIQHTMDGAGVKSADAVAHLRSLPMRICRLPKPPTVKTSPGCVGPKAPVLQSIWRNWSGTSRSRASAAIFSWCSPQVQRRSGLQWRNRPRREWERPILAGRRAWRTYFDNAPQRQGHAAGSVRDRSLLSWCVRNANNYSSYEYYSHECPMSNVFLQCKMLGSEVPPKRGETSPGTG